MCACAHFITLLIDKMFQGVKTTKQTLSLLTEFAQVHSKCTQRLNVWKATSHTPYQGQYGDGCISGRNACFTILG